MKLLELLEEYVILQFPSAPRLKLRTDLALGDWQIARFSELYCEVFFLTTGESLRIEKDLLRLCSFFYSSRSDEIVRAEDTKDSALWELIVLSSRIISGKSIDPRRLKSTKKFRIWFKERFNLDFGPLIYFSREDTIKI